MKLYPALKIDGKVYKGERDDSHVTIAFSNNLPEPTESQRGFTPDGKMFLTRKQALGFLRQMDIKLFRKLPSEAHYIGLHSEHLAKAYGIEQKPEAQKMTEQAIEIRELREQLDGTTTNDTKTNSNRSAEDSKELSDKTAIIYDRGLYLYLAETLAKTFKKVYYHLPQSEPYPCSKLHNIATGIKGVERCFDFWGTIGKCDIIIFPDTYDGSLQEYLRSKGHRVFGSGCGEKVETDKVFFMECLEKHGLPLPKTYLAEGIDDLLQYLKKEGGPKWLKGNTRGDFETKKYTDMDHFQPFLDDLRHRLGKRLDTMEFLVQDPIDSECEAGYDGFCVDGEFSGNCLLGYEVKDKAFVASVVEEPAPVVKYINDAFSPVFNELGYRGAYSTEIRITKDGVPYYIDPTTRFGSPPGELMSLLYDNYAQIIWDCAEGKIPTPEPRKKYGAQIVLTSDWYRDDHEMYVEFPRKYRDNLKLSNYYVKDGKTYVVPNDTEQYFGSVVTIADSVEQAIDECKKILDEIKCEKFKWDENAFEEATKIIQCGKKFGLKF